MATSNSIDFALNKTNIITRAMQKAGVLGLGETADSDDFNMVADSLNMMLKHWMAQGAHLWTEERGTIFLTKSIRKYTLGTGGDHAARTSDVVNTTISADEGSAQTVLSVTSSTGMTANDNVGIVLDDDSIHWTTISTVDSSIQITVATGLASASGSGNRVYSYTTIIERPLTISQAFLRDKDTIDRQIRTESRSEYFLKSDKVNESEPLSYHYEPTIGTGTLYVYPTPGNSDSTLEVIFSRTIEDLDATTDNIDLPQEWHLAIVYGLAALIADDFELYDRSAFLQQKADVFLSQVATWDSEKVSIMMEPDL